MFRRIILAILILSLQTACAVNLESLVGKEKDLKRRADFNSYLALEYLEYSRSLADKYRWNEADYFSKKGLLASNYQPVFPEVPESWDLDASKIEEATLGRQKLVGFLNSREKQILPIQVAHLMMLYDCWISKEKEPWQLADMAKCKIRFFKLAKEIENYKSKYKVEKVTEAIKPPEFKKFDIYFDLDSSKVNEKAVSDLLDVFTYLHDLNGDYRIMLVGAADRTGPKVYNQALARERVLIVQNYLIKNGVPERFIEVKSLGEDNPDLITEDSKQSQNNRRVAIYILKGPDSISEIPLPLIDNYIYKEEITKAKKERGIK